MERSWEGEGLKVGAQMRTRVGGSNEVEQKEIVIKEVGIGRERSGILLWRRGLKKGSEGL